MPNLALRSLVEDWLTRRATDTRHEALRQGVCLASLFLPARLSHGQWMDVLAQKLRIGPCFMNCFVGQLKPANGTQ